MDITFWLKKRRKNRKKAAFSSQKAAF